MKLKILYTIKALLILSCCKNDNSNINKEEIWVISDVCIDESSVPNYLKTDLMAFNFVAPNLRFNFKNDTILEVKALPSTSVYKVYYKVLNDSIQIKHDWMDYKFKLLKNTSSKMRLIGIFRGVKGEIEIQKK